VSVKTKIRYNGQDYSRPADLPPDVRAAYQKALHDGAVKKRFVINGQQFASEENMPTDVRKLCDDAVDLIDNNGEVTIPTGEEVEPLITKKEMAIVALLAGGIIALVAARLIAG
jgi:hypothetical protein